MRAQLFENIGNLKALRDACTREFMLRQTGDVFTSVANATRTRRECAADHVEKSTLSRAIRTNDAREFARFKLNTHIIERNKISKTLRYAFNF